jgi:predicted ATP-grasp superfamily ATP-dependent carboligase
VRILVYEFVTGGGWLAQSPDEPLPESLAREGAAMAAALAADLAAVPGIEAVLLRDARLERWHPASAAEGPIEVRAVTDAASADDVLFRTAADCDWAIVIAPEIDGALAQTCERLRELGCHLLAPSAEFITLTSDKQQTAERLCAAGVPAPRGCLLSEDDHALHAAGLPAVIKPRDGAGSQEVRLIRTWDELLSVRDSIARSAQSTAPLDKPAVAPELDHFRIEELCRGTAASVLVLCGQHENVPLPPCTQRLNSDGSFEYRGGSAPVAADLVERAQRLAIAALDAVPGGFGFIGIDLVLGERGDGRDDFAIEINPRLTTSYVGLRALARVNLAAAMLDLCEGREASLSFDPGPVEFEPDGQVFTSADR